MKRTYSKPELFCEEYELSTAIAGNCSAELHAYNITTSSIASCGYKMGPDTIFIHESACDSIPDFEGADGTFCYHQPNDSSIMFSS